MDKEQINELKPGDEILIRGRFEKIKENGDYSISYLLTTVHGKLYMYKAAVHPSAVIIKSPPKHDPTRLFREGDKVRVVERDGRSWWQLDPSTSIVADEIYTVLEDESEIIEGGYGELRIEAKGKEYELPFYFLELATPVEELEPYYVGVYSDQDNTYFDVATRNGFTVVRFDEDLHPNAKAAAEAECARLNDEYRKEHGNEKIYS